MIETAEIQKLSWEVGDLIVKKRAEDSHSEMRLLIERLDSKRVVKWRCSVFLPGETREIVCALRDPQRSLWKLVTQTEVSS